MNKQLKIASVVLLLLGAGVAASNAQSDGVFKLKHRSSFAGAPSRNPFWPIGWVKGQSTSQNAPEETAVPITADKFEVTSISTGSAPLAVINGKTYAEGETIIALYGDQKIKILVVAINDGEVVLQYLDKKYVIPMKHPELAHNPVDPDDALIKKDNNVLILH